MARAGIQPVEAIAHGADRSSAEVIEPERLDNMVGRAAYTYWRALRGVRQMPARSQLSPREMREILAYTVLIRVVDGGRDYEFRIVGETFVEAFGLQFRDTRLSEFEEFDPEHGARIRNLYEHVRRSTAPLALRGWIGSESPNYRFGYYETVVLPFGEDGNTVDHLLAAGIHVPKM